MTRDNERSSRNSGDFRLDGGWNPSAEVHHRGPLYRWIASIVELRRTLTRAVPPAEIASIIKGSQWAEAFPEVVAGEWDHLTQFGDWYRVPTRTTAEEAVKRCGWGATEDGHWESGRWLPTKDERKHEPLTDGSAKVAALVKGLARVTGEGG